MRIFVSTQVVAKIKSRCFWSFPRQTDTKKIVKNRGGIWNMSRQCQDHVYEYVRLSQHMYCIAYRHFLTLCLPSKAIQGYENLGVYTGCCQNKITMLLEFPKTDRLDKICEGPRWNISRQCGKHVYDYVGC